jgi:hypothetical protein
VKVPRERHQITPIAVVLKAGHRRRYVTPFQSRPEACENRRHFVICMDIQQFDLPFESVQSISTRRI